jgi:hypothetical protein
VFVPLSPQQKTRNESFGFFYFFRFQKFTFGNKGEIKKTNQNLFLVWVFIVGLPFWDHEIIPLSPQQETRNESFGFFYFLPFQKFTFENKEEIKNQPKLSLV